MGVHMLACQCTPWLTSWNGTGSSVDYRAVRERGSNGSYFWGMRPLIAGQLWCVDAVVLTIMGWICKKGPTWKHHAPTSASIKAIG